MQGFGARLRLRAEALGLSDAAIADRLGLSQQRYHYYVSDRNEPDLAMLARICRVLDVGPGWLLGMAPDHVLEEDELLRSRVAAAVASLDPQTMELVAVMVEAAAKRRTAAAASGRSRRKT